MAFTGRGVWHPTTEPRTRPAGYGWGDCRLRWRRRQSGDNGPALAGMRRVKTEVGQKRDLSSAFILTAPDDANAAVDRCSSTAPVAPLRRNPLQTR